MKPWLPAPAVLMAMTELGVSSLLLRPTSWRFRRDLHPTAASASLLDRRRLAFAAKGSLKHCPLETFRTAPLFSATSASPSTMDGTRDEEEDDGDIGAWIPLLSIRSMTGLGPQRVTVMGVDLVVWHTEVGAKRGEVPEWRAQVDACAHRLAPLSQGRVDPKTSCIECPYHGWQFDCDGKVARIPQLEKDKSISTVQKSGGNIKNFPVHAVGDLLFVFLPSSLHGETYPQSLLPENHYPHLLGDDAPTGQMFVRELPYSFDFLVENFMDPAHIPFAHHSLQSTREDGTPVDMARLVYNHTMVEVSFRDVTRKRERDGYMAFQRPSYYHFGEYKGEGVDESTGKKSKVPVLKIYCVPVRAGRCRIFMYAFPIKLPVPLLHAANNRFLNTDAWLHDAEREVVKRREAPGSAGRGKIAGMDYLSVSRSDVGVSAFRQWWSVYGMADAPPHTFGMASLSQLGPNPLSWRDQIHPWESHAKHCATCRRGLRMIKRGQAVCLFAAIAGATLSRRVPLLGLVGAAFFLWLRALLNRFATAIEGNPEISRVGDRSVAAAAD